ncbi:UNVERIFIED_CONTAM: hypothetical protein PYX00_007248 [Menopon gallinae]|uniref:OPA3-like protein n=1 Tax=Menopon gallinae TaxID=328185 RepID=A0AAW2HIA5_9NEOP
MWLMNLGKPVNIPPLNEAMAIELGANLLGEGILFAVAAAIVIIEYSRQATKQAAKEQQQEDDMNKLTRQIQELAFETERQQAEIRALYRHVLDLDSRVVKVPWTSQREDPEPDEVIVEKPDGTNKGALGRALSYVENDLFRV